LVSAASANMVNDSHLPLNYLMSQRNRVWASRRIREIVSAYDYTREAPAVQQWMQAMA
jgi:hypothetical protein